jgi:hypothetical protein
MELEVGARPGTFGEFGVALVGEVFTPDFLRHQLNVALDSMLRGVDRLPGFPADVASAQAGTPKLIEDDGYERRFAVTLRVRLESGIGRRTLALGIDAKLEVDLTIRVGTFRPAMVRLDIDPVTPDDLRVRVRTRSDWLPLSLFDGAGGSRTVQRSLPVFALAVNRALEASERRRQVDVLERVRRSQRVRSWATTATEPRTGTLEPGESLPWSIELGEQERVRLQLWACLTSEPDTTPADESGSASALTGSASSGSASSGSASSGSAIELSVSDADGEPIDELSLAVRRTLPDLDTTSTVVEVTATGPGGYWARLANHGSRAVSYRVEERRDTVAGERIGFAEFGEVLIGRGIDRSLITNVINSHLSGSAQVIVDAPMLLRGSVTVGLADVAPAPAKADELRFRVSLDITVEFLVGPGAKATVVSATWRAGVGLRVSTLIDPATVLVVFEPVSPADLELVVAPHRVSGRRIPLPHRTLTESVPRRVRHELNQRLEEASRRIVVTELAAEQPGFAAETPHALPARTTFTGVVDAERPGRHTVRLAERQHIRAKARIVATAADRVDIENPRRSGLTAELAVCDEHGGVWAADQASIPDNGEPTIVGIEFTAPHAGQWRLRVSSLGGPGDLEYELQVRPEPQDDAE